MITLRNNISIVLGGSAGQGIQTIESLLMMTLKSEGYFVFATKEYMSRIRGGSNSTEIRITSQKQSAYTQNIDMLIPLDEEVLRHVAKRITKETLILADTNSLKGTYAHEMFDLPLKRMAMDFGNLVFANTIAVGVILGILKVDMLSFETVLRKVFGRKGEAMVLKNIQAGEAGYKLGQHMSFLQGLDVAIAHHKERQDDLLLSGSDALGMGVVAAGCNFISSYPMSPGTTLLTFLAQVSKKFNIAVEQVEDEISAINMALGASYAGARAIVTTSGGGFALMEEGVSLAAMIETPIVIHIAQRPGPATGLPTRTEQADLNLALYSGHGEFPRAIFAPGSPEEIFEIAQQAFLIADTYQSPVFILTDQYILDAVSCVSEHDLKRVPVQNMFIETQKDYKRYEVTADGISPRGIPGFGEGLVVVDSDEHTEDGHLTEDLDVRVTMMEKRMQKLVGMRQDVLAPVMSSESKGEIMLVGFGSTKGVIQEAIIRSGRTDITALHFSQVYPLPENVLSYFEGVKKVIVIENNFTGQFAQLLKLHDVRIDETVLKYNGEPFSVEELTKKCKSL